MKKTYGKKRYLYSCLLILSLVFTGCASTGGNNANVTQITQAQSEDTASASTTTPRPDEPNLPCRVDITQQIVKTDGTLEILTADALLYHIDKAKNVQFVRRLNDTAQNYSLLNEMNVIVHWHSDRVMLEYVQNESELFKLDADISDHRLWSTPSEVALKNTSGKYNVWDAQKGFGGITTTETVQSFINRQSPDHQIGFPGELRAMALGARGHIAVAIDDLQTGKNGLVYHFDASTDAKKLTVLGRTNTKVQTIAISPSSRYVAAVDETGQLFLSKTDDKGFIVFAQKYQNVRHITFLNDDLAIVQPGRLALIDTQTGNPRFEINAEYDKCEANGQSLSCIGRRLLDTISADGTIIQSLAFYDGHSATIQNNQILGDLKCQ